MSEEKRQQRRHCCVSHEFVRAATENPNKIAVIHARSSDIGPQISSHPPVYEGDRCFTFGDVLSSVNHLSFRLRSILDGASDQHVTMPHSPPGGGNDTDEYTKYVFVPIKRSEEFRNTYTPKVVGIYMAPSVEYIVSVLSVMRCGEAFLPLDPLWPKDRILSVASSSNVDLIVTCGTLIGGNGFRNLDDSQWLAEQCSCPVFFFSMAESLQECVAPLKLVWPCEKEKERLFCYLMYTSGSTGKPKGVCGTETGLLNRFLWMQESYPLYGEELLLFKTSISFIDHLQEFLGAMFTSCTLIIPPFNERKENLLSIITFLKAYSINRLTAVPSLLRAIVPALQSAHNMQIQSSLKVLILSGEVFTLSLWKMLSSLLPLTSILNLYGSTEVSGDCTYFDCKRLPKILETEAEALTTVPIGVPISNCDVVLVGEFDKPEQGEICVGGLCICNGYFCESTILSVEHESHQKSTVNCSVECCKNQVYYKSGDLARRIQSGDLVFLGRRDRTVKVNGQRIAIEEIENTLRGHPNVADAAVIARKNLEELLLLEAFILLKDKEKSSDVIRSSIRSWIVSKLPTAMIPSRFSFIESLHMTPSGKVDYALLASSTSHDISKTVNGDLLQAIKKAFCDTLMVEEVSSDDDFFMLGGDSITAAHVSYNLGIDMRLLYNFPSPSKLVALLEEEGSTGVRTNVGLKLNVNMGADIGKVSYSITANHLSPEPQLQLHKMPPGKNDNRSEISKRLKMDTYKYITPQCIFPSDGYPWNSATIPFACSFSRCNKVLYERGCMLKNSPQATWLSNGSGNIRGSLKDWWKVHMESCVDASPVVAFKDKDIFLFIGSHSRKFICIDARSGSVQWETVLDGRIECSAAIVGDFSQVVVGCYKGKIYFLDFAIGSILWTFQTCDEVKSQPVMDFHRQLVWCGSHDHNLYALDYRNHCCVFKLPCGGSVYGSPAIDEVQDILYVASTSGRVTAISVKEFPFHTLWEHELRVPVFGSLSISPNGPVICCSVDGYVVALNSSGNAIWRSRTDGPIFAGACISHVLPSQVLICSRSGKVYSFELGNGNLLWEYNVGDPLTASAYAEEHLQLVSDSPHLPDRLVCVCSSSGSICVLRVNSDAADRPYHPSNITVHEFARFELQGDVFSSPVMIGGKIFVGCRDDYVHCISIATIEK